MSKRLILIATAPAILLTVAFFNKRVTRPVLAAEDPVLQDAHATIAEGRTTFRFDTFQDQTYWGDQLKLHQAIEGAKAGGVGLGLSPKSALALGLEVDSQALPQSLQQAILHGNVDLGDPATTVALMKLNAVVGITGVFDNTGSLRSMGIQCALCHSVVDNSFAPGIGRRLDGWANRDLNVGAIVALAPNLQPIADVLKSTCRRFEQSSILAGPGTF